MQMAATRNVSRRAIRHAYRFAQLSIQPGGNVLRPQFTVSAEAGGAEMDAKPLGFAHVADESVCVGPLQRCAIGAERFLRGSQRGRTGLGRRMIACLIEVSSPSVLGRSASSRRLNREPKQLSWRPAEA
jgi:hypothetical protein